MKKRLYHSGFLIVFPALFSYGQNHTVQSAEWKAGSLDQKVCIENNGQFDEKMNGKNGKILFSASQQGIDMYWNAQGLTYRISEYYLSEEAKKEMKENGGESEEKMKEMQIRFHYLNMKWEGSNPKPVIISEEPVSYYFTYPDPNDKAGKSGIKASAFKKITYKNIYPGIDVQYVLPEKGGVKYSFIIHPGADPSVINIRYSGADKTNLNSQGEIEINSGLCGNYLEHSPVTSYKNGTPVHSEFSMKGKNIFGFNISSYDKTQTLIIDPWVSVVSFPTNYPANQSASACAKTGYDVCYDDKGNAWVLGGDIFTNPYVAKYDNAGNLKWIYKVSLGTSGPWGTADLIGDIEINKVSGTCYVAQGADVWVNNSGAKIYKLNPQGGLVATFPGHKNCGEISRLRLTCSGRLYGTGGGINAQGLFQSFSIDTNLTAMTGTHITASPNGDHDSNLMTLDPSGNFMYQNFNYPAPGSPDFLSNNEMHKEPLPGFTPSAWMNPGPIYHFVELNSMLYAGPVPGMSSCLNMFNGMICGNGFLYTYNGDTIKKWDKSSGTLLGQVVTGGKVNWSGGLDLDLCENVYAGVSNKVKVYDSNLNLINTYSLPDTSCYDLKVDKNKNLLYATGVGYVCAITITPPVINLTTSVTPAGCGGCNGTASANISCNTTAFNYNWFPGGQTTSSITGLCAGTYTVIASAAISCAKNISDTAVVTIPSAAGNPPTASMNHTNAACNSGGSATVVASNGTSPYTYSWSPAGGTNASATGLNAGTYTVTVTDSKGCSVTDTVSIISSGSLAITAGPVTTICTGQTITLSASGGTNFLWSTGNTTSSISVSPTATSTYSVSVSDPASGCSADTIVKVTVSLPPVASASPATICSGQNGMLTASGGGNYLWSNGATTSSITISPAANTTYSVIVSIGSCADTTNAAVTVNPSPAVSLGNDQTICSGQNITLDAGNSGASYLWSTGATTQTIHTSSAGTFWVIVGLNNCLAKDTLKTFSTPQIHLFDSSLCTTSPIVLDPGNNASSYLWNNGSTSQTISVDVAGNYWVQAMFGNCPSSDTARITGEAGMGALYVPNAFTPNEDGLNEVFLAKGTGIISFDMKIFDRWGNLIFTSSDVNKGWNGMIQGGNYTLKKDGDKISQEDVYVWKVDYTTQCFPKTIKKEMGRVSIVK